MCFQVSRDNKQNDDNNGSGSIWTLVSKAICFLLVIGLMIGGGAIGSYMSSGNEGGAVFVGVLAGLIVGLLIVSGHMMLVDMVDNIADSKRYLRSIRDMLAKHYTEQRCDDIFDPRKKTIPPSQAEPPV